MRMKFARPLLLLLVLLLCSCCVWTSQALLLRTTKPAPTNIAAAAGAAVPVNPDVSLIQEAACLDTAQRMVRISVPVSTQVHPSGQVGISYASWPAQKQTKTKIKNCLPPVVLIHGFDSSCLEYRRFGSRLAARGLDTYAVDLLGWGFSQLDGVTSFSAQSKLEALNSFLETVVVGSGSGSAAGGEFMIAGASLGGAAAIEVAATNPKCKGLVLMDAQGFVDGIGPMTALPKPLARLGVEVLKSVPLRSSANQMSYFDKQLYATDEAVVIGRLHCLREGWADALVSFMQSGGFSPSNKVPTIQVPSLVLWGRQDGILDGEEFANKFLETLPDARLVWIEECGHVPHLEKPEETADAITAFVRERLSRTSAASSEEDAMLLPKKLGVLGAVAGATAFLAAFAADFLPVH